MCNVSCVTSHVSCVTCDFKWLGLFEEGLLSTWLLRLVFRSVLPTWNPNQRCKFYKYDSREDMNVFVQFVRHVLNIFVGGVLEGFPFFMASMFMLF